MTKFTEQAIKQTFVELLREKPLNEITIKEIVERCNINRNTFYYHYRDIPALVEEIMVEETDRILESHTDINSVEDCMYAILDFVKENQQTILHIYKSLNRTVFEKYLWKLCRHLVDNFWQNSTLATRLPAEDHYLITNFYTSACFGLAMDWLAEGMPGETARQDIKRLFEIAETEKNLGILV